MSLVLLFVRASAVRGPAASRLIQGSLPLLGFSAVPVAAGALGG